MRSTVVTTALLLALAGTAHAQPGLDPSHIRLPSAADLTGEWRLTGRDARGVYGGSARLVQQGDALELLAERVQRDRRTASRHPARRAGAALVIQLDAGEATYDLSPDATRLVRRDADETLWRAAPRAAAPADPARTAAALRELSALIDHGVDPRRVTDAAAAERAAAKFTERLRKLEAEWTKRALAADREPARRPELMAAFADLEEALGERGLTAREAFEAASAGPVALADRLRETAAVHDEVWDLIERTSDELLELQKTWAANRLDLTRAQKDAAVDQAHARAVAELRARLDGMVAGGRLDPARRTDLLDQALRRLDAVRQREVDRNLYPPSLTIPIGTPRWEAAMDQVLGPRRGNQKVEVIVDPGEYHAALLRVLGAADHKLFLSLMMFEPDRASLKVTDALSMRVRRAEEVVSSLSIINRIAARALGMRWEEYTALRAKVTAKDIRDLRIAQARLGGGLSLDDPQVVRHALEVVGRLPEQERIALARALFPTDDVKVLLDGKLCDMKLLGGILNLVGIVLNPTAVPMKLLTGGQGNLRTAVAAIGNDAEPLRYVREAVGHPLRAVEDTAHFVLHPIRFAYGDARDLHDVGVEVAYENRLFDGTNLGELLGLNHEKVVLARTKEGTIQAVVSGNNIGAKHFPTGDGRYLWHDAGVWLEGGVASAAEDLVRYQVRHWNDVVRAERKLERVIDDAELAAWLPTAGPGVGDVTARIINIEPGRQRSFATAVLSGIAAADKGIEIVMPFLGSEAVLDQLGATADRWLKEGWEPRRRFDPADPACWADPKCRRFVVVLPGWLDGGFSQFGTWRSIHRLLDRGVEVVRWRPKYGETRTPDGRAIYDRKAMLHAKAGRFYDARGRGFCFVGSGNLMTPVIELGLMRDLSLYSDDPRVMRALDEKLIAPTIAQSVPAKKPRWPFRMWNEVIGLITRPFQ